MVRYEWNIETVEVISPETVDEYLKVHDVEIGDEGDIQENYFSDKLTEYREDEVEEALEKKAEDFRFNRLVLVRDDGEKTWAYVENNKLPEYFEDCFQLKRAKVPKRFHQELARRMKKLCVS